MNVNERSFILKRVMADDTRGAKARTEILEAAKRLFLTKGYGGTSMRDIARESGGRAVGGIYNHYPTKQAIFRALIEANSPYEELLPMLEAASGPTAPAIVADLLRRVLPVMNKHYEFIELLQIDVREFHGENVLRMVQTTIWPRVLAVVQRVAALPGLSVTEPVVLVRFIVSAVAGFILTQRLAPAFLIETFPEQVWIDHFVSLVLHGIAALQHDEGRAAP